VVLYPWVVISHVVFVILAFGAHGVSAFAMFRVKRETDRVRMSAVLDLSTAALVAAGIGLLIAVGLGMVAAIMGGHFSRFWPWAAIIVVVATWIAMSPLAANPLSKVRHALGLPSREDKKGEAPKPRSDEELATAQANLKPHLVTVVGIIAIVVLVWLMEAKPF